ncbi:hypothetical protein [Viscerimonas tarda]
MKKIFFTAALLFSFLCSPVVGQESAEQKAELRTQKQMAESPEAAGMSQQLKDDYKALLYRMNLEVVKAGQDYPPEFEEYLAKIDDIRKRYNEPLGKVVEVSNNEQVHLDRLRKLKSLIEMTPQQETDAGKILMAASQRKPAKTLEGQIMDVNAMRQKNTQLRRLFTPQQNRVLMQNDFFLETPERECAVQDYLNGIKRNTELRKDQETALKEIIRTYYRMEDIAKLETDQQHADSIKHEASRFMFEKLNKILVEGQWEVYLVNCSKSAATKATAQKMRVLKKHDQYTEEQLSRFDKEIYSFILNENILRLRHKFDEKKLQDGLREMKKLEPMSLRKASALEKLSDNAKAYRGTYQW